MHFCSSCSTHLAQGNQMLLMIFLKQSHRSIQKDRSFSKELFTCSDQKYIFVCVHASIHICMMVCAGVKKVALYALCSCPALGSRIHGCS